MPTSPNLSNFVYVSILPNPISDKDCLRVALDRGPSSVGLTANFSTKVSGSFRSAGRDNRLLISSWLDIFRDKVDFWRILTPGKKEKKRKKGVSFISTLFIPCFFYAHHIRRESAGLDDVWEPDDNKS